ncbi:hypothetical protein SERLA73DRAFT_81054 [Serpula lacrymans var. lacrymans S7.3]|uniref:Uncharacterized protein n=1 Tax=Serpula lacrymans var. lacrymans (strain S7.3) TaxID=936435 RepID=F8QKN5_SERL3|nr:hypothetical protein SERLA73DRAFT_81054 [Serpula lacrymans var. lacrymans S7.3]
MTQNYKERNPKQKDATRVKAAQSDETSAVPTAGKSLESAAFTIDTKIPTPDAANSTEENAAETVEERSGTPLKKPRTEVWTPEWVVNRLRDQKEERSIGILSAWTHKKRAREVTRETIKEINRLPKVEAIQAIIEIASPKKYIRGTQGNQMKRKM